MLSFSLNPTDLVDIVGARAVIERFVNAQQI